MMKVETYTETRELYFIDEKTGEIYSRKTELTFPHTTAETPHLQRLFVAMLILSAVFVLIALPLGVIYDSNHDPHLLPFLIPAIVAFIACGLVAMVANSEMDDKSWLANEETWEERDRAIEAVGGYVRKCEAEQARADIISQKLFQNLLTKE